MAVNLSDTNLLVEAGLDLLDNSGTLIEDISSDLLSGVIRHDAYRKISATARLRVTRELQWSSQWLRPRITVTDSDGNSESWNLGVFVMTTPRKQVGETPETFDVECYDLSYVLDTNLTATYTADSGDAYVTEAETLLGAPGNVTVTLDQTEVAATLGEDWSFEFTNGKNTYLAVASTLLAAVGYDTPYLDRDGVARSGPYLPLSSRSLAYTITSGQVLSMVSEQDLHGVPNKWVGINTNIAQASVPTEGTGIYTVTNQSDGQSSVDSRGFTVTKIIRVDDADDQAALVETVDRIVDEDRAPSTVVRCTTGPIPSLWHKDKVTVQVPERGPTIACESAEWTLDLVSGRMSHVLRQNP